MKVNDRFEYMATLFLKEHGVMAPGKDRAIPDGISDEDRVNLWKGWTDKFYSELFDLHQRSTEDVLKN